MFPVTAFHILCFNINLGLPRSRMLREPDPRVNEMKVLDVRRGFQTVAGETVVIDMVIVFLAQFNGLVSGKIYSLSLSPYLSIHPCTWQSTNQSIYLPACLSIYLSIYLSMYESVHPSIHLPISSPSDRYPLPPSQAITFLKQPEGFSCWVVRSLNYYCMYVNVLICCRSYIYIHVCVYILACRSPHAHLPNEIVTASRSRQRSRENATKAQAGTAEQ